MGRMGAAPPMKRLNGSGATGLVVCTGAGDAAGVGTAEDVVGTGSANYKRTRRS